MKDESPSLRSLQERTAELQQQRAWSEALFASIGDGAITTDEHGKVNHVNEAALKMLGLTEEEVIGQWFPKIIVAEDEDGKIIKPIQRPITRAFLTGKTVNDKLRYRLPNGKVLPVALTVSPIILNKRPLGAVEIFRDIAHEQEVDRMKTEFIYLASHQLRTPLTAVKTYAHMLQEGYRGELSREQSEFMDIIIASLDRMNDIISTLLNISRIEAGRMAVTPTPVKVEELLDQALEELQPSLNTKHIKVIRRIETLPPILTDQLLAKEVCMNLLSNAIKYTPAEGTITITLAQDDNQQVLSVQDTGYGIPKHAQPHIFSKFYRASNVLDKVEGGTGLGLYLVKGIADVLLAEVWFKSRENKGTTFFFALPDSGPGQKNNPYTIDNSGPPNK